MLAFGADPCAVSQKLRAALPVEAAADTKFRGQAVVAKDYPVNQREIYVALEAPGLMATLASNGRQAGRRCSRQPSIWC